MKYVNLIIDNASDHTDNLYTYGSEIPGLKPGDKVTVPFARGNRQREAYVHSVADALDPKIGAVKQVAAKDEEISLPPLAMELCGWMRERYLCRYIDAVKCFLPAGKPPKRKKAEALSQGIPAAENRNLEDRDGEGCAPECSAPKQQGAENHPLEIGKDLPQLTREQEKALERIRPWILAGEHRVFLLHGVTSSGKTEIYMRAIAQCISRGKTALMLLPEIALTAQVIQRFSERFGEENLAVLHSRLSAGQRYDQWMRARQGRAKIVIGARSALFAPLDHIGAVILDEEHEGTYKSDMTPKYETAEVAVRLAELHKAVVILGSATPSLAAFYRAERGEYEYLQLAERYNKAPLPAVEIADMRSELISGNKSIFSRDLYREIQDCLSRKQQVILFLNRRGYTTFLSCRSCGYVMRCPECNISLTYHKAAGAAVCHYCGFREEIPAACPQCGGKYIKHFGAGTEKVEELAGELFPGASVERLDMDTVKRKGSIEGILSRFSKGKTDILIGTQLVAKGLDFANVGLVGIVAADVSLNIPDYRSPERTFQLVTQAAGRAGRGDKPGKVIIQTYSPDHYAVRTASGQDYRSFYEIEIGIRRQLSYPPFSDLIQLVLAADTEEEAASGAEKIRDAFLRRTGMAHSPFLLGPKPAPINKVKDQYRRQILIKCLPENRELYQKVLFSIKNKVTAEKGKEWSFSIDVNPYGFL